MNKEIVCRFARRQWREWRATIFFILFVLVPMKSSWADWNWVPSGSMNPTIIEGDLVYINKLAYDLRFPLTMHRLKSWGDPEKGDIVVLFSPVDGTRLVKRVVGVPGDEIEMRNNILFVNGTRLDYDRLPGSRFQDVAPRLRDNAVFAREDLCGREHAVMGIPSVATSLRNIPRTVVPEGQYFVMGDNRDNSSDSRVFGFADRKLIIGEASNVIASFNILDKYQPRLRRFFTSLE